MVDENPNFNLSRLLLGLAGGLFVAGLALAGGALIILGTQTETYLNLERSLERFFGN
jgi:hypothetical protein